MADQHDELQAGDEVPAVAVAAPAAAVAAAAIAALGPAVAAAAAAAPQDAQKATLSLLTAQASALASFMPTISKLAATQAEQASDAALARLKRPDSKEIASVINALTDSRVSEADRPLLAKAMLEQLAQREDDDVSVEDQHDALKTAVAKIKSLTSDQRTS